MTPGLSQVSPAHTPSPRGCFPPKPRFPHVLPPHGAGSAGDDLDGRVPAVAVDEDDAAEPTGPAHRAQVEQLPLGDGHTALGNDLHHSWEWMTSVSILPTPWDCQQKIHLGKLLGG